MANWEYTSCQGYHDITNALLEDAVMELASSPLEIRYLRDYGETSRVILDSILENNSKVTSKLESSLSEIQEARSHLEKLRADMDSFRIECDTIRKEYERIRQDHDQLLAGLMVLKEEMVRRREAVQKAESEVKVKPAATLYHRRPQYKMGDDLDRLLARLCKINREIFE